MGSKRPIGLVMVEQRHSCASIAREIGGGVTRQAIRKVVRGETRGRLQRYAVAKVLGHDVDELAWVGEDEESAGQKAA
jgi:hypothetical protein